MYIKWAVVRNPIHFASSAVFAGIRMTRPMGTGVGAFSLSAALTPAVDNQRLSVVPVHRQVRAEEAYSLVYIKHRQQEPTNALTLNRVPTCLL